MPEIEIKSIEQVKPEREDGIIIWRAEMSNGEYVETDADTEDDAREKILDGYEPSPDETADKSPNKYPKQPTDDETES